MTEKIIAVWLAESRHSLIFTAVPINARPFAIFSATWSMSNCMKAQAIKDLHYSWYLKILKPRPRRKRSPKTEPFGNALQTGAIWKGCFLKTLFSGVDGDQKTMLAENGMHIVGLWISVDQLNTSQLATPCLRDPTRSKQLSTIAFWLSVWTLSCHCPVKLST